MIAHCTNLEKGVLGKLSCHVIAVEGSGVIVVFQCGWKKSAGF